MRQVDDGGLARSIRGAPAGGLGAPRRPESRAPPFSAPPRPPRPGPRIAPTGPPPAPPTPSTGPHQC